MASPTHTSGLKQGVVAPASSMTVAAGFTFTSGRQAVVAFSKVSVGATTISGVTIAGTAATKYGSVAIGNESFEIWAVLGSGVSASNNNVVFTNSGSDTFAIDFSVEEWAASTFSGDQSAAKNTSTGSTATPSVSSATSVSATAVVYSGYFPYAAQTNNGMTGPSGWTQTFAQQNSTAAPGGVAGYHEETSSGTKTASYTRSGSTDGGAVIVAFTEGAATVTGTGAITLGPVAVSGTGERVVPGSGAITLGPVVVDGTGAIGGEETGSGDIPLGALTVSGSGAASRDATGAITLGVITVDGTAEREVVSAGGAVELTLGAITVDGTGGINSEITGTGTIALGPVSVAGTAEREQTGTGAVTLGPVAVAGLAERVATGTGAIALGPVTVDGTGTDAPAGTEIGSGDITLGAITVSAAANIASNSQSSGGWWPDWEYLRKQRRKRQREIEEAKSEAQRIQDELDRQIALEQRRIEAEQAEKADLERLQRLADRYAAQKMPELPKPVRVAILNAKDARTKNSLEQMRRAIEQANEQELLTAHLQQLLML